MVRTTGFQSVNRGSTPRRATVEVDVVGHRVKYDKKKEIRYLDSRVCACSSLCFCYMVE